MAIETLENSQITVKSALARALGQMKQAGQTASPKECRVTTDDRGIRVAVPTDVCPGKLLKWVAEAADIQDIQVAELPVTHAGEKVTVTLAFAKMQAHLGCKGIPGGRPTNLEMLRRVLEVICKPMPVSVSNLE